MNWPYDDKHPPLPPRQENGHYAAGTDGRQYQPAGNFDYAAHDRWVEAGHCPVVASSKAYCSSAPHEREFTPHRSPRLLPGSGSVMDLW